MILLFTDFGLEGPYIGQMKSVLLQQAPDIPVIDLMHDAPAFNPKLSAYMLASLVSEFPEECVFLCVVDPGVGSHRKPVIGRIDNRWYVGPGNGLFYAVALQAQFPEQISFWEINWQPQRLSSSFHGRDLFAPVAAMLANGDSPPGKPLAFKLSNIEQYGADITCIIYIDHFGNAITGIRAATLDRQAILQCGRVSFQWAHTFADVAVGDCFWYENSNGLVELSMNQGRAVDAYGIELGDEVVVISVD